MTDSPQQTQREHSGASPGTMLREAREAANLTQAAVGEALHLSAHYIRSLEKARSLPDQCQARKVAIPATMAISVSQRAALSASSCVFDFVRCASSTNRTTCDH